MQYLKLYHGLSWQVAAAKETKMNQSNLAKILGPTVIGYSSMEALPEEIMKEVATFETFKYDHYQLEVVVHCWGIIWTQIGFRKSFLVGGGTGGDYGEADRDRQRLLEHIPRTARRRGLI